MKTPKLYDSVRHPETAANIAVVGNLTVLLYQICRGEVLFVLNSNIQSFQQGHSNRAVEFTSTDDTVFLRLRTGSAPVQVQAAGLMYDVSLAEIGSESKPGVKGVLDYCIFDVTQRSDPTDSH